jgi:hypothetical protein
MVLETADVIELEVINGAAALANEMDVFFQIRLESVEGASEIEPAGTALFHQNIEVPIHVPKAEAGKLWLQPVIDAHGSWMVFAVPEYFEDTITLFAGPCLSLHKSERRRPGKRYSLRRHASIWVVVYNALHYQ